MKAETIVRLVVVIAAIPIGYLLFRGVLALDFSEQIAFGVAFVVMMGMAIALPGTIAARI